MNLPPLNSRLFKIFFVNSALFLVVCAFVFANTGCATLSNEISLKKMRPSERVYTGRIKVKLNDLSEPKCEVYLNFDIAPSIKLSSDGFLVYKTDREKFKLKKIACYHKYSDRMAAWHLHDLNLAPILKTDTGSEAIYFGDIEISWQIDPELSRESAEKDNDMSTPMKTGRVNDSGEMKITILDRFTEMQTEFFQKVPHATEKGMTLKSAMVQLSKE